MQRIFAQVTHASRLYETLLESGACDASLVWAVPRMALALQCTMPPLDEAELATASGLGEFVEGAAHAYETLNALVYRRSTTRDLGLLERTCTPQMARVLSATAEELHGADRAMTYTLEESALARRSLRAAVCDTFATERERELEHALRGYDDLLHDLETDEARSKMLVSMGEELTELRAARGDEHGAVEAPFVSCEFDVLFESNERMSVEAAGQTVVVEKRQLSTWRFLTTDLDDVEWRLAKIF